MAFTLLNLVAMIALIISVHRQDGSIDKLKKENQRLRYERELMRSTAERTNHRLLRLSEWDQLSRSSTNPDKHWALSIILNARDEINMGLKNTRDGASGR